MSSFLPDGERILMVAPGMIDMGASAVSWEIGSLYLTSKRLSFGNESNIRFSALLDNLVDVRLEVRKWVLQHITQLGIHYWAGPNAGTSVVYVAVRSPRRWRQAIKDRMTLALLNDEQWEYNPQQPPSAV
jgi:hypothetical protein